MFHFFDAITNVKGDALIGYFVSVTDASGNSVSLYSDDSATPIVNVSGIANMAKVDANGNVSFWISPGEYTLNIYAADATTLYLSTPNMPMGLNTITLATGSSVPDRATLAAISLPLNLQEARLMEAGREGMFVFSSANLQTQVTADPNQGIYVAPTSDTSGATGAWVRKSDGRHLVDHFGASSSVTDNTSVIQQAITTLSALGLNTLDFSAGSNYPVTTALSFSANNFIINGNNAKITSSLDGKVLNFGGNNLKVRYLQIYQAATGADPAPYCEVNGSGVEIERCTFTRDATAHIPFYVRSTASGFRFRNNSCTWYGGVDVIADANDLEITGNSFVNPNATASDDAIAIKSTGSGSRHILIDNNYFEGMADFVGIGSEIGVLATTDATYSHEVAGVIITNNRGKNCSYMVYIKPGAIDGVDYRDGTVRGVTISNNTLIDLSGTNLVTGIFISAGRGARIFGVSGKNNKIIGRFKTGAANLMVQSVYARNDGTGTADVVIDDVNVGIEYFDPYTGVASGVGGAVGSPPASLVEVQKASTSHGTVTNVTIDADCNATSSNGIRVYGGLDDAVTIRRGVLENINVSNTGGAGTIRVASRVKVFNEDISMSGNGPPYVLEAGGSIVRATGQSAVRGTVKGRASSAAGTGAFTPGVHALDFRAWSTVATGWIGLVRFEDGNDYEISFCYWNGTTLSRGANQRFDSSTGSLLTLTVNATATMIGNLPDYSPLKARLKAQWVPAPGSSAASVIGIGAPTVTGTAAGVSVTATNFLTQQPRVQYTSATTASAQAGLSLTSGSSTSFYTTSSGIGGFEFTSRFGASTIPTGPRLFVGMTGASYAGSTAEPSAFAASYAVFSLDSTDTNIQFMTGNGTSGVKTDTGIPLVANGWYEGNIWSDPGGGTIYGLLIRVDTGAIWYGSRTTNLPATGVLFPHVLGGLNGTNTGTAMVLHVGSFTVAPRL